MAATIDDFLTSESGRIGPDLFRDSIHESPWIRLSDRDTWPDGMGQTISANTFDRVLPTSTPSWETISQNDGTGNTCVPEAHRIDFAQTQRTYNLQHVALESPPLCVNDLRFAWQRKEQLTAMFDILRENSRHLWEERYRDEFVRVANNKVIAKTALPTGTTAFPTQEPTSRLTQGILDYYHQALVRDGAGREAVEKVDMRPQFMVVMSPETQEHILKDVNATTGIREDFRYSPRAKELLAPLGVQRPYKGFFHLVDDFPPRYNFTGGAWVKVEPYVAEAATQGNRFKVNPAYVSASYEDTIIFHPKVLTTLLPAPISSPGGGTKFNPLKALGEWRWLNIPDRVENPDGTWGYYRSVFSSGSKPVKPNWGYVIRHKRCDLANQLLDCPS